MFKKVVSIIILPIFILTSILLDFIYIKALNPFISFDEKLFSSAHAAVYCLSPNQGSQTPVFDPIIGYCTIPPLDPQGKCASPYVYSTTNKVCVLTPSCSGAEYWDTNTKQCVAFSGGSIPEDSEPVFPDNSCAVDLNGNGEVEQNEIFQCIQTAQGYICPQGQTQCVAQYSQPSCPGGYTYNSQTQKCEASVTQGVCSSQQVSTTNYQCPTNGQVYSDLTTCNSNCLQTAQCNLTNAPVSITGSGSWSSSLWWSPGGFIPSPYFVIEGSGSSLFFYSYDSTYIVNVPGASFSGTLGKKCPCANVYISGNQIVMHQFYCGGYGCYNAPAYQYLTFSNVSITGGYNNIGYASGSVHNIIVSGNYIELSSKYSGSFGKLYFNRSGYVCPLPGGSACTGNPPTCTAGQSCITYNSTVTKWQCSLNGAQYDTQSACTTNCHSACPSGGTYNPSTGKCEATATCQSGTLQSQGCLTGYGCPLGSQYQCHQVGGQWMCSPNECITQTQLIDEGDLLPQGLEDDGIRDENGNCLGTLYIFNGKALRCRKSGIQTGFHNCCNESQGKLYDSTGSTGFASVTDAVKAIAAVYQAIRLGSIAYNAQMITINLTKGTVNVLSGPGNIVTYSLASPEGAAFANTALSHGVQVGEPSGLGATFNMTGVNKDAVVGSTLGNYIEQLGPQIAMAVIQLAISQIVKDPVLASSINLVATVSAMKLGFIPVSYIGIALAAINLVMSLFMKKCDQQDILTSTLNESKYCHEVGEYCVKKWKFVGCVQKAKGFCCFNSKLARIIHEQGRQQLAGFNFSGDWGDPKNPNCRGFFPEEFQALDFNKIDLSEYIEDIQRNVRQNLEQNLQQQFNQTMQDLTGK